MKYIGFFSEIMKLINYNNNNTTLIIKSTFMYSNKKKLIKR